MLAQVPSGGVLTIQGDPLPVSLRGGVDSHWDVRAIQLDTEGRAICSPGSAQGAVMLWGEPEAWRYDFRSSLIGCGLGVAVVLVALVLLLRWRPGGGR